MAGPYYADMAIVHEGTEGLAGTVGVAWGGGAGIERMFDTLAAGETGYIVNAATPANNQKLTDLWKVPCTNTTNFAVADLATIDVGDENCTGRIAVIVAGDYVLLEAVTGTFGNLVATDTITTAPGGGNTTLDDTPSQPGLLVSADFCASGTVGAQIRIRGVASDASTPENVFLDAESTSTHIVGFDGNVEYWDMRNIDGYMPAGVGFSNNDATDRDNWVFRSCGVRGASAGSRTGSHGWNEMRYMPYVIMADCWANFTGDDGIRNFANFGTLTRFWAEGNADRGLNGTLTGSVITDSVFVDNVGVGIYLTGNGVLVQGCIIDGNGTGIKLDVQTRDNVCVQNCRLTNNGDYGIDDANGFNYSRMSEYNVFYGNSTASVRNWECGLTDHGPNGDTAFVVANRGVAADGYVDDANGDYSLVSDAVLRREAVTVGDTTLYATAGFAPADRPRIPRMVGA